MLVREARNASEDKLRQATEKYNACLDRLESEKAALNAKLAQKDLEIIRLNAGLEEIKCTVETQVQNYFQQFCSHTHLTL